MKKTFIDPTVGKFAGSGVWEHMLQSQLTSTGTAHLTHPNMESFNFRINPPLSVKATFRFENHCVDITVTLITFTTSQMTLYFFTRGRNNTTSATPSINDKTSTICERSAASRQFE